MGVNNLHRFLEQQCPDQIENIDLKKLRGHTVVVDARLMIYQFLVAMRQGSGAGGNYSYAPLSSDNGEATSHIAGFISRTLKLLREQITPIYVFDGKPPSLKSGECAKRDATRKQADQELADAKERGDEEAIRLLEGRTVRVTQQHQEEIIEIMTAMGIQALTAPCEAEAACADLVKRNKAYAIVTEDSDALTFGATRLIRHLWSTAASKKSSGPIQIVRESILQRLGLSHTEFIDFCILCGCDYVDNCKGIGPNTAFQLIRQYHTIEEIIKSPQFQAKFQVPEEFPYIEARKEFESPEVLKDFQVARPKPDLDVFKKFLLDRSFKLETINSWCEQITTLRKQAPAKRIDQFFKIISSKKIEPVVVKQLPLPATKRPRAGANGKRNTDENEKVKEAI